MYGIGAGFQMIAAVGTEASGSFRAAVERSENGLAA